MAPGMKLNWATLTVSSDSDPSLNSSPIPVKTTRHRIGRVPGRNETVVKSNVVSTSHCTFSTTWEPDDEEVVNKGDDSVLLKVFVMDHSTNGTFVDGERLPSKKKVQIKHGARIFLSKGTAQVSATTVTLELVRVPRAKLPVAGAAGASAQLTSSTGVVGFHGADPANNELEVRSMAMTGDSTAGGVGIGSEASAGSPPPAGASGQDGVHLKAWMQKSAQKTKVKEAKLREQFAEELEQEKHKYLEGVEKHEARVQELNAQLEDNKKFWQADQSLLTQRDETIREMTVVIEDNKAELGRLKEELVDSKQKVESIKTQGSKTTATLSQTRTELSQSNQRVTILETEIVNIKAERDEYMAKNSSMDQALKELGSKLAVVNCELATERDNATEAQDKLKEFVESIADLKRELKRQTNTLKQVETREAKNKELMKELRSTGTETKAKFQESAEELSKSQAEIERLSTELKALEENNLSHVKKLENQIEEQMHQVSDVSTERDALQLELNIARSTRDGQKQLLGALRSAFLPLENLFNNNAALFDSFSNRSIDGARGGDGAGGSGDSRNSSPRKGASHMMHHDAFDGGETDNDDDDDDGDFDMTQKVEQNAGTIDEQTAIESTEQTEIVGENPILSSLSTSASAQTASDMTKVDITATSNSTNTTAEGGGQAKQAANASSEITTAPQAAETQTAATMVQDDGLGPTQQGDDVDDDDDDNDDVKIVEREKLGAAAAAAAAAVVRNNRNSDDGMMPPPAAITPGKHKRGRSEDDEGGGNEKTTLIKRSRQEGGGVMIVNASATCTPGAASPIFDGVPPTLEMDEEDDEGEVEKQDTTQQQEMDSSNMQGFTLVSQPTFGRGGFLGGVEFKTQKSLSSSPDSKGSNDDNSNDDDDDDNDEEGEGNSIEAKNTNATIGGNDSNNKGSDSSACAPITNGQIMLSHSPSPPHAPVDLTTRKGGKRKVTGKPTGKATLGAKKTTTKRSSRLRSKKTKVNVLSDDEDLDEGWE